MKNNYCATCGMPLTDPEDLGMSNQQGSFCKYCTTPDKKVKSCDDIFNGGVHFFMTSIPGTDRNFAEKIVRKNMNALSYWKGKKHPILQGPQASDEEFNEILGKLE